MIDRFIKIWAVAVGIGCLVVFSHFSLPPPPEHKPAEDSWDRDLPRELVQKLKTNVGLAMRKVDPADQNYREKKLQHCRQLEQAEMAYYANECWNELRRVLGR